MKQIADHSFEGRSLGFQCMNRFKQANLKGLRSRASELQDAGASLYEFYNFMPLGTEKFLPAAVIIAEGQLTEVKPTIVQNGTDYLGQLNIGGNTYGDVIRALGATRGDQMTLCTVEKDSEGEYKFYFVRVILDPRNQDGSGAAR